MFCCPRVCERTLLCVLVRSLSRAHRLVLCSGRQSSPLIPGLFWSRFMNPSALESTKHLWKVSLFTKTKAASFQRKSFICSVRTLMNGKRSWKLATAIIGIKSRANGVICVFVLESSAVRWHKHDWNMNKRTPPSALPPPHRQSHGFSFDARGNATETVSVNGSSLPSWFLHTAPVLPLIVMNESWAC